MGSIFALISSIFLLSLSSVSSHETPEALLQCIGIHAQIQHNIHVPESPSYEYLLSHARQNPRWSNLTCEQPFLIVAPHEEDEIRSVVMCSKMLGYQIRVKSGGHDYEGLSFRAETPFVMVDVSNLNKTVFDLEEETVWIQTGVTLGQLYYEIAQKSNVHAFAGGLFPTVGSGGHISGGGLGTLMRKYGLAADNVLDARIMDVNGRILDRKAMGEDLFWAIRGGGGASFGVILAWKLKLARVPENVTIFSFRRKLDPENMSLLQKWQNTAYNLSNDIFMRILVQNRGSGLPGDEKMVTVTYNGLFLGPADQFAASMNQSFPEFEVTTEDCFNSPVGNPSCSDKPCIKKECYQVTEFGYNFFSNLSFSIKFPEFVPPYQVSWIKSVLFFRGWTIGRPIDNLLNKTMGTNFYKATSDFLTSPIPDQGWKMIHDMFLSEDQPIIIIDSLGGRMDEICEDETPFPHRKGSLFNVQYMVNWAINNETEMNRHLNWIRDLYGKMEPYVANGPRTAYVNYKDLDLGKNDEACSYDQAKIWGEKYFKGNFERLARVKGMVDPDNFFRNEQSIPVLSCN